MRNTTIAKETIGQPPYYYRESDNWSLFIERLEQYCRVNNLADTPKQKSLLLYQCGESIYQILRDLSYPNLPKDKSYTELVNMMTERNNPQTLIIYARRQFYQAQQFENESISEWYHRIRYLSIDCKFDPELQTIICDRFVSGLWSSEIVTRLSEEFYTSLTLDRVYEIALAKEIGLKNQENIKK